MGTSFALVAFLRVSAGACPCFRGPRLAGTFRADGIFTIFKDLGRAKRNSSAVCACLED